MQNYYVYKHLKADTKIPYYIGYGKKEEDCWDTLKGEFSRAYDFYARNYLWKRCYAKHGCIVEIIANNLTFEEAQKIEIDHIALYKRYCDGGSLTNIQPGGEGNRMGHSEETKKKISRKGEAHPNHKLSEFQVSEAKQLFNVGFSTTEIANYLGVTVSEVSAITRGVVWSWVEPKITRVKPKGNRLTAPIVADIKIAMVEGVENRDIVKKFKIGKTTISKIKAGKIWSEVLPELVIPKRGKGFKCWPEQIREIKTLYKQGINPIELAGQFGLCKEYVTRVVNNKVWKEIVV